MWWSRVCQQACWASLATRSWLPRAGNPDEINAGAHAHTHTTNGTPAPPKRRFREDQRQHLRRAAGSCRRAVSFTAWRRRGPRARLSRDKQASFLDGFSGPPPPPSSVSEVTRCPGGAAARAQGACEFLKGGGVGIERGDGILWGQS